MNDNPLLALFGYFAMLSLFAVGGANAAIPEMHRIAVDAMHWMSDRQFADSFAIAQMSPGPNVIIVTLIGYHVAGLAGAGVATVAMCGPTCMLAFFVARVWDRFKDAPWRRAIQAGLVWPAILGVLASAVGLVYYLRLVKIMYFDEPAPAFDKDVGLGSQALLALCAAFALLFIVAASPIITAADAAAKALLP